MNLYQTFKEAAFRYPRKTAVVQGKQAVSYQELEAIVSGIASDLRQLGVAPGQMIGLCFGNSIAYIALTYALWRLDAAVVPVDAESKPEEIRRICEQMQLDGMIQQSKGDAGWIPGKCPVIGTGYYFRGLQQQSRGKPGMHIAFVRFTSGTTGSRKGVVLSHERILERIQAVNKVLQIDCKDSILWTMSMSHHFVSTIVLYLSMGATIVLAQSVWSSSLLKLIQQTRVSLIYASPFHYSLLAADQSGLMMPPVRLAISTAAGLPREVQEGFLSRFQLPLVQAYGIIETGLVCINTEDPQAKPDSVGRVLPDYKLHIANKQTYSRPGGLESGELYFSGPGFFEAYFNPWMEEGQTLQQGWFETGDIGTLDEDGFLYLQTRKDHVINMAGIKIFPQEVEAELNGHPAVKESCVFGKAHDRWGQVVAAKVVLQGAGPKLEPGELKSFCRSRLAAYKVPEKIEFTSQIQKTRTTGKIIRPQ
ncbi:MAG: class I adenylate-forming enzyme family protein [Thermodesulfobacteriota bacterium]